MGNAPSTRAKRHARRVVGSGSLFEYGEDHLQQLLREAAHLPAGEISARISAEMKNWIRDAEQFDDLTFIVMKVR